jgi:MoaA/NifB/PqqE/SkfB family radical SAM enzyme
LHPGNYRFGVCPEFWNSCVVSFTATFGNCACCSVRVDNRHGWLEFLWLELTAKCNLRCVHCYAESAPDRPLHQKLTLHDWKRALREGADVGCDNVQFIGGEPTLYPGLADLLHEARSNGYKTVEVYTNGTAFTARLKRAFADLGIDLAFSVYADDAAVHDAITLQKGSLARTTENIKWAVAAGLDVRAGIIRTALNANVVARTEKFLEGLGVRSIGVDRERGIGRAAGGSGASEPQDELCGRCWEGKLCVAPDGQVFPCVFARFCAAGTLDQGLRRILNGEKLLGFRKQMSSGVTPKPSLQCVPLGSPCSPDQYSPCLPMGGPRPCVPQGGPCTPQIPPCVPEGRCTPNACRPNSRGAVRPLPSGIETAHRK